MKYSQIQQDQFVISVLDQVQTGTFVDVGCQRPFEISNTLLLEEKGWSGIALDIVDYSVEWEERVAPFIQTNVLECDFSLIFEQHNLPEVIDYLSIDLERNGDRFRALEQVLAADHQFRVITIEHDVYKGYRDTEQLPQRELLSQLGYALVAADVCGAQGLPMEDWWVNTSFVKAGQYARFLSNNMIFRDIFEAHDG